jgi:hypothetical protein
MDIYARILHVYIFLGGEIFWEDGIWLDFNGFDQLSNEFPWLKQLQASSSTSRSNETSAVSLQAVWMNID